MDELNREYLLEQFRLVEEYLRRARGIAGWSRESYLLDKNAVDASVRQITVLFETCHNHLTDFERFLSCVARWLAGEREE